MSNIDLFNNPSNDYVSPSFPPCSNVGDSYTFEFLPKEQVGVTDGLDILTSMQFSSLKIPVTTWNQQKKVLQSGEVTYINGLTKGLTYKQQAFTITYTPFSSANDKYYLKLA
jgi:hypothetical protein